MSSESRLRVNTPTVTHDTIDGESIVINLYTGNYYSLRGTASEIWALIADNARVGVIIEELCRRYSRARVGIQEGVTQFLAELEREQLIVPAIPDAVVTPDQNTRRSPANESAEPTAFPMPLLEKFTDMQELLLLDPIHEVDETGWPRVEPGPVD